MADHPSSLPRWEKSGDSIIATTRIFDVRAAKYRHPVKKLDRDFFIVHAPEWVNVLAVTPKHELVLVRQFRFGIDTFSLEIPGGIIDPGEPPVEAGLRELREETGFVGEGRLFGQVHPNPAFMNNLCHFVLVENAVLSSALEWDPDEEIEVLTAPIDQVYAWAHEGRISHSLVLNALFFFAPLWAAMAGGTETRRASQ